MLPPGHGGCSCRRVLMPTMGGRHLARKSIGDRAHLLTLNAESHKRTLIMLLVESVEKYMNTLQRWARSMHSNLALCSISILHASCGRDHSDEKARV